MARRIVCSMPSASTCLRIAAVVLIVLTAPAPHAPGQTTTTPSPGSSASPATTYRSATEIVALQVAVTDSHMRYVPGLNLEDFGVFEEGVRQTVTLFAAASTPLDVMLLLDTSSSMRARMDLAQEAAINFVRALRPGDRSAVVLFSQNVRVAQPLTEDTASVENAIRTASPSGGTAVHQAIYIALRELVRVRQGDGQLRRQALVVLTDGDDNSSHISFDDVLDAARRSAVTVYTVVPPSAGTRFETVFRPRPLPLFDLRSLAQETGGRAFVPTRIEDLAGAYQEIAEELSQLYWLAYVPAGSGGGFRRVSVRVETQPGLRARTRSGYYAREPRHRVAAPRTTR